MCELGIEEQTNRLRYLISAKHNIEPSTLKMKFEFTPGPHYFAGVRHTHKVQGWIAKIIVFSRDEQIDMIETPQFCAYGTIAFALKGMCEQVSSNLCPRSHEGHKAPACELAAS